MANTIEYNHNNNNKSLLNTIGQKNNCTCNKLRANYNTGKNKTTILFI